MSSLVGRVFATFVSTFLRPPAAAATALASTATLSDIVYCVGKLKRRRGGGGRGVNFQEMIKLFLSCCPMALHKHGCLDSYFVGASQG